MTRIALQNIQGVDEFFVEFVPDPDNQGDGQNADSKLPTRVNIPALASTVQKSKVWLGELMIALDWTDGPKTYHALAAVLHALRDRLTIHETADLAAQMPMLIRGMFYQGWRPEHVPVKDRSVDAFLDRIRQRLPKDENVDPEQLTRAVWSVMAKHVSQGELDDILAIIPKPLRSLFA